MVRDRRLTSFALHANEPAWRTARDSHLAVPRRGPSLRQIATLAIRHTRSRPSGSASGSMRLEGRASRGA